MFHQTGGDDVIRTSLRGPSSGGALVQSNGILRGSSRASRRGVKLYESGELSGAAQAFEQAISIDPSNGSAHNNLGLVRFDQRRLADAADHFSTAAEFLPEDPTPLNNLGMTLESGGRAMEAIDYYEQASMVQPRNPLYLGNLVRAKIRMGDQDELVVSQLQTLAMIENRPEWVRWVQDQLALEFNPMLDRGGNSEAANPFSKSMDASERPANGIELHPPAVSQLGEESLGPNVILEDQVFDENGLEVWPESRIDFPEVIPTPQAPALPEPFIVPAPMGYPLE